MEDDRSEGARPSWRGKGTPDRHERTAPRAKPSFHKWATRGARQADGSRPPGLRRAQLFAVLAAFAACLGLAVWLIWMLNQPQPTAVVLLGADYATNPAVPHNVLGYQGLAGLERISQTPKPWALFNPGGLQLLIGPDGRTVLETASEWDARIAALKKGFRAPTLIIMLALHGGSDSGGAYLMPNQMKQPEDRLDMRKVIASMKELPPAKTKILVVEGAQITADWRLGLIHNDFPRRLKELEPEIRSVPNLWVLSGCDVDQRCWVSEGLGRTIFSYYISEALQGGDAAGSDRQLSLKELYQYVRSNVRRWVWAARGAVQEPVLLPDFAPTVDEPVRSDPASIDLATVDARAQIQPTPTLDRDALSEAWRHFRRLDALAPHPSACTPMRWRAYRAALVRYEQLLLAGAADTAQSLRERLTQLERSILKDRRLEKVDASTGINLVMDALKEGTKSPADPPEFLEIAETDDTRKAEKLWDALRSRESSAAEGDNAFRPLRNRFAEYLLRRTQEDLPVRAAEDGAKVLARAADRIRLVGLVDEPLPAEAHFLRMLSAYLSPPPENDRRSYWSLVAQALRVRALAERAAMGVPPRHDGFPYYEQVHAWTRSVVEQADLKRRTGEDRLFAADARAWELARNDFNTAEEGYNLTLRQAGAIRSALAARDRAFAELPDYSRWLVHRATADARDDLPALVKDMWVKAHQLSSTLEQPDKRADFAVIERAAHELNADFEKLVEQFVRESQSIQNDRRSEDWEVESAAVAVLFPDDAKLTRRAAIWDRLDHIREHDVAVARSTSSTSDATGQPDRELIAATARRRTALEGTMAVAALGENWFNSFPDHDQGDDYRNTLESLGDRPAQTKNADPWWPVVARQGDRIGQRFRALREKIATLADERRGITAFAEFESRLATADRLARLIDRGEDPPPGSSVEPSSRYRQARVHDLLIQIAGRAWLDHWYTEKPSAPPYYQAIVARLFKDAEGLFPECHEADQKERERLSARGRLTFEGPERLVVTSELETSAEYHVVDKTGPGLAVVPPGFPVVRPRVRGPLGLVGKSAAYGVAERGSSAEVEFSLNTPFGVLAESRAAGFETLLANPGGQRAGLDVDGFFRGQVFSHQTEVALQVVPDAVEIGPANVPASVGVKASDEIIRRFGEGTGSIAVVLDCSGSMRSDGKWSDAKRALHKVLGESVPRRTTLSIWTFSQLRPGVVVNAKGDLDMKGNTKTQIDQAKSDETNPEQTIEPQRHQSRWAPDQLDDVQQMLDALQPYHHTPLVAAMWRAAMTDLSGTIGFKNLLVLTDGNDDRFQHDGQLNPNGQLDIPTFLLEKFRPLGIRVTVVYFHAGKQADPKELEAARNNFEKPLRRLEPPGQFVQAKDLDELTAYLRAGLEQKLVCQIFKADADPAAEPLQFTPADGDLPRWWRAGLDPGIYTIRVLADRPFEQRINLERSDRMIVELVADGSGGIGFRRALYGDDQSFRDETIAPSPPGEPWRMNVSHQQKIGDKTAGLGLMTAIESTATADETLKQVRPGWVEFRLNVADRAEPPSDLALRWRQRMAYPGPVWQLDVPIWPADPADLSHAARPSLTAWWLGPGPLPHDAEFRPGSRPFNVLSADGPAAVRVEDFRLEDHYVEVNPGELPKSQPCLVIRLAYSKKDRPFFVDPASLNALNVPITGYEHRYYSRAGKYAGLFWPVNASMFDVLRGGKFGLVSLTKLRGDAEKHRQKLEIKLGRPSDHTEFPEPPRIIAE